MRRRRYIEATVEPGWIDSLGHVNFLEYQRIADLAADALWLELCGGRTVASRADELFAYVDLQVRYLRELTLGDRVAVETRVLGFDAKRMAVQHEVLRGDEVSCRMVTVAVSFNLGDRKVRAFAPDVLDRLARLVDPLPEAPLPALRIPG